MLDDIDQNDILFKHHSRRKHPKLPLPTRTSTKIFRYFAAKSKNRKKLAKKILKVPKTKAKQRDGQKAGKRALPELRKAKYM